MVPTLRRGNVRERGNKMPDGSGRRAFFVPAVLFQV